MKNLALIALVLISSIACASKMKISSADAKDLTPLTQVISLSKTPCYGTCPVFTLKIYNTGLAVLDGQKYVKRIGLFEMMLTADEVTSLMQSCDDAELFSMKDDYSERVMDLPTTTLVYSPEGKTKKIRGNMKFPEGFKNVVKECMDLLDDDRWTLKEAYNTK